MTEAPLQGEMIVKRSPIKHAKERLLMMREKLRETGLLRDDMPVLETPANVNFSKNVRLTSREQELNPEFLMRVARLNRIKHKDYNPTISNKEWSQHFREIFEKYSKAGVLEDVDFEKEFCIRSRFPVRRSESQVSRFNKNMADAETNNNLAITEPFEIKSIEDIQRYRMGLKTSKIFRNFHQTFEDVSQLLEQHKSQRELQETQEFLRSHYDKTMVRKTAAVRNLQRPGYLKAFKYVADHDVKEKLIAVKNGTYSLEKEDIQLCNILKDLQQNRANAGQKIQRVGLLKFNERMSTTIRSKVESSVENILSPIVENDQLKQRQYEF